MSIFKYKKVRTAGIYLLALLLISVVLVLFNPREGGLSHSRLGGAIGLIALILLPVAFIAHKWRNLLEASEVFSLQEYILEEEEIKEAVRLWVYIRDREQIEGDIQFEKEEEGQQICRYYLRQS